EEEPGEDLRAVGALRVVGDSEAVDDGERLTGLDVSVGDLRRCCGHVDGDGAGCVGAVLASEPGLISCAESFDSWRELRHEHVLSKRSECRRRRSPAGDYLVPCRSA